MRRKERRRREDDDPAARWGILCKPTLLFRASLGFLSFTALVLGSFHLIGDTVHPGLKTAWPSATMNAVATEQLASNHDVDATSPALQLQHAVAFPDQVLLIIKHPSSPLSAQLQCLYFPSSLNGSPSTIRLSPFSVVPSSHYLHIHCPAGPPDSLVSVSPSSVELNPLQPELWNQVVYASIVDLQSNSTILFAKGLNLRSARISDPSRYACVFGWEFSERKYILSTPVISAAQEIFRCLTPPDVLKRLPTDGNKEPPLVSIRTKGRASIILPSVTRPYPLTVERPIAKVSMCVCTVLRNQARFLHEWIMYHSHIGVKRWFIYDNNSDDDIEEVISSLVDHNVTRHPWPWIKSQEAGFAHCALRARDHCEWVGFIDVDEFLYFPGNATLDDVLEKYEGRPRVGELRMACHSFGPSGRKEVPQEGVTVGYTCRLAAPERHKSIVRPSALNPSLINIVHHFHLKDGMRFVDIGQGTMLINHYKYQVWEVFKEKFYRRVATYVADWQDEANVGSKDRAPGLGTRAVEPDDWPNRFCEVYDPGLKDYVLMTLADLQTGALPWQTATEKLQEI